MNVLVIGLALYLLFGLLGYTSIAGTGDTLGKARKPSLLRRVMVVILWPLAMIGAIEC
jgi:hypothetical protein